MRTAMISVAVAASWLAAAEARAASFDCKKAKTKLEKLICETPELSRADDELGALFKQALKAVGKSSARGLREAQSLWLSRYRNDCADAACVLAAYQKRILELRATVKPSGRSGSYERGDDSLDVLEVAPGKLRFELMLTFEPGNPDSPNGQLCGEVALDKAGRGTFAEEDCELSFSFPAKGPAVLAQKGDCSFGAGVIADGKYARSGGATAPGFSFCYRYQPVAPKP